MADAEDVLLAAAEHVGAATRALWQRHAEDPGAAHAAAAERRLAAWLAVLGAEPLALTAWEAPPKLRWLARTLGRPAPWQERPRAVAWSDGRQLFLPAAALRSAAPEDAARVLLAALAQGQRVARGRLPDPAARAVARDVRFVLEAALGDAELAAALPGLAPALDAARARALSARPSLERLRPAEREVESLVRALLAGPASAGERGATVIAPDATRGGDGSETDRESRSTRERIDREAADAVASGTAAHVDQAAQAWEARLAALAGGYRGVAPVEHWGAPAPPGALEATPRPQPSGRPLRHGRRPRSRSLPRPVLRRAAEEEDPASRPGPFAVPHGDPHLALQDARGVERPEDRGEEDLDALAEELARAGTLPTVRSEGDVGEVLEAGPRSAGALASAAAAPETAGAATVFLYPEWDAGRGAYRTPGIVLRERLLQAADSARAARLRAGQAALLARLRRQFEALRPRRERVGRQLEGDQVDVDGIVSEHAERRAGLAPEGRLYARERPRRRDVAVTLLVDASGSTDAWMSRGARVIDVARQAALCLGEALAALGDRHAILAFSGRGPGDVRVGVAKRFAEPWGDAVRARVAALEPDRSTRLGGPIRHATAGLARQSARARLLLVLSDGKPDDDDAYEGAYGLEDVRQAVLEARHAGVRPFCVTIDRTGPAYLPHLFGPHGYTVLWDVEQLPERLPAIYRRLIGV
jgi:nitric oxide reductase NorD protein